MNFFFPGAQGQRFALWAVEIFALDIKDYYSLRNEKLQIGKLSILARAHVLTLVHSLFNIAYS